MARTPKNGKSGETEVTATTLIMPTTKVVQDLAKFRRNTKKRTQGIAGELGGEIAKAVENKHLDRKAHAIACQLDAMDDERLAVTLPHLMRYIDDLGLVERANKQAQMFEEGETGDDAHADGKVTRLGTAARKVAEQAGAPTG